MRTYWASLALIGFVLSTSAASCPPANTTPTQRAAYYANQAVLRVGELQAAAIAANQGGGLTDHDSVTIVRFTVDAAATIKTLPNGWLVTVTTAYAQVKAAVRPVAGSPVALAFSVLDTLLATIQTGAP